MVLRCNGFGHTTRGGGHGPDCVSFFRSLTTVKSQTRDALARLRAIAPDLAEWNFSGTNDLLGRDDLPSRLAVVDLVIGRTREYTNLPVNQDQANRPVGWLPDGSAVLLWQPAPPPGIVWAGVTPGFDGDEAA